MNMSETATFRTPDTALSAFLVSEGFSYDIHFNGERAYFLFEQSLKLQKYISAYDSARAKGNIVLFFNAYQNLLRRIKERY